MLLAVDTSTAQIGLALYDGSKVLGELNWTSQQHHTTELAPALAGLLARSGATIGQVSALGVAIGPGSFTALRVGLAFVKGLALARRLPLIGVPTLDVVAAAQPIRQPQQRDEKDQSAHDVKTPDEGHGLRQPGKPHGRKRTVTEGLDAGQSTSGRP